MNTSCDVLDATQVIHRSAFYVCDDWKHGCINDGLDIVTMTTGQGVIYNNTSLLEK